MAIASSTTWKSSSKPGVVLEPAQRACAEVHLEDAVLRNGHEGCVVFCHVAHQPEYRPDDAAMADADSRPADGFQPCPDPPRQDLVAFGSRAGWNEAPFLLDAGLQPFRDRKSTRLNSSH